MYTIAFPAVEAVSNDLLVIFLQQHSGLSLRQIQKLSEETHFTIEEIFHWHQGKLVAVYLK